MTEFNAGINERFRGQQFNELFNLATLGSNAAAGQATATQQGAAASGNFMTQAGNAQAAGIVGAGTAINQGINNMAFLSLMNRNQPNQNLGIVGTSDIRLKENIEHIGDINGINIYRWDWNDIAVDLGIDEPTFGVIAQEVISSGYVIEHDGWLRVDYGGLFSAN